MSVFDDSALEDRAALAGADDVLRRLAGAGPRLREEAAEASDSLTALVDVDRPRAIVAAGSEARLIRALLEPVCPVPFVAWPHHGLPGWVGALDLVVVMAAEHTGAGNGASPALLATVHEATRRGARLVIACPPASAVAEHAASSATTVLPTRTGDTLAAAIIACTALHQLQVGPAVDAVAVAAAMDRVAEECSPYQDLTLNPAKDLALGLAEAQPLVWGGSVLAARAARRMAEALRPASGRTALAAAADELLPVIDGVVARDPFADPFEDGGSTDRRPCLVVLDDGTDDDLLRAEQHRLTEAAERNDIRVCVVRHAEGVEVERYAGLLQTGLYASVYLAIGLGRYLPPEGIDQF